MSSRAYYSSEDLAEKISERRKLLADEYGIHSDEELIRELDKMKPVIESFIFLMGGETELAAWRRRHG